MKILRQGSNYGNGIGLSLKSLKMPEEAHALLEIVSHFEETNAEVRVRIQRDGRMDLTESGSRALCSIQMQSSKGLT